jgi:thiol-disulfide isomerase/thioredoxin
MFVKLSDVKAAYTVVVFWDNDCGHCKEEIPVILNAYYEMLNQKIDVKVFSVYMQYEVEDYIKYVEELKLPWINVYDGCRVNNTIQKYDVTSTPIIYVLDKNKIIKAKRIGANQVSEVIKSLKLEN